MRALAACLCASAIKAAALRYWSGWSPDVMGRRNFAARRRDITLIPTWRGISGTDMAGEACCPRRRAWPLPPRSPAGSPRRPATSPVRRRTPPGRAPAGHRNAAPGLAPGREMASSPWGGGVEAIVPTIGDQVPRWGIMGTNRPPGAGPLRPDGAVPDEAGRRGLRCRDGMSARGALSPSRPPAQPAPAAGLWRRQPYPDGGCATARSRAMPSGRYRSRRRQGVTAMSRLRDRPLTAGGPGRRSAVRP